MLSDAEIRPSLEMLYDRGFKHGYTQGLQDLEMVKKKLEEMIELLKAREGR